MRTRPTPLLRPAAMLLLMVHLVLVMMRQVVTSPRMAPVAMLLFPRPLALTLLLVVTVRAARRKFPARSPATPTPLLATMTVLLLRLLPWSACPGRCSSLLLSCSPYKIIEF